MTNTEALEILKQYQAWRRGADTEMLEPKDIGKAIDIAIDALKRTQWQPIETAPKDEFERFLAKGDNYGSPNMGSHIVIAEAYERRYVDEAENKLEHLTHWMPLPPAP